MSKMHYAQTICQNINGLMDGIISNINSEQGQKFPAGFQSADINIVNKSGGKTEPMAKAIHLLLCEASKRTNPPLDITWKEPVQSGNSYQFGFSINEPVSIEKLTHIRSVRLGSQIELIQHEIAHKIPLASKLDKHKYAIAKDKFKHITPESFVDLCALWKEEYNLEGGLQVSYKDEKVEVSITKLAAQTLRNKEQIGQGISEQDLKQGFAQNSGLQRSPQKKKPTARTIVKSEKEKEDVEPNSSFVKREEDKGHKRKLSYASEVMDPANTSQGVSL